MNKFTKNSPWQLDTQSLATYEELSRKIRSYVLQMALNSPTVHIGGSFSCVEILVSLYFNVLKRSETFENSDKFILSKGHAAPALYATLALAGYFDPKELLNLCRSGGILDGHPDPRVTPGVFVATGSLGLGISVACGVAYISKKDLAFQVFVLMSDGELDEGIVWESAMFARHYHLGTLTVIVDRNYMQYTDSTENVMTLEPLGKKWESFGWRVITVDGHDFTQLVNALSQREKDRPTVIIAKTVKGKGVSFMENSSEWHVGSLTESLYKRALQEIWK
jgi:transketolase